MTKNEVDSWLKAVSRAMPHAQDDEELDFYREWLWMLYVALYGAKRAREIWSLKNVPV